MAGYDSYSFCLDPDPYQNSAWISVTIFFRSLIRICINDTGTDPPHYATLWNKGLRYKALFFYYLPQSINRTAVAAAFRVLSVYVPPSTICFWRCSRRRRRAHFAQLRARRACGASGRVGATASDKCHSAPCHPVPTSSLKERGKFISSDGIEMAIIFLAKSPTMWGLYFTSDLP